MIPLDGAALVGVLGDTEGNQPWVFDRISKFAEAGITTVLHLGDFHLGVGDPRVSKGRLIRTDRWLQKHEQTWLITPGNHENWDRLNAKRPGPHGLLWFGERVAFIPRGHRWAWHSVDFVSLGGAPSVNRERLTPGRSWWADEQITNDDVERVIGAGHADVMLAHDAPDPLTPSVQRIVDSNPHRLDAETLEYAGVGRDRLTRAFASVRPRLLLHGHHHVHDRSHVQLAQANFETEIVALAADDMPRNAAVLHLGGGPERLRVEII
ncbi:hypothetical protein ASD11_15035 [Aeromicrobium sp. Root495]|uniref:metallophosphoesterase n=1 Tax=Aeromicrobium sp. Root495 TaxID=1736550 RepID=UPI0006F46DE7|nr:metallophosphoesterase [Aeromicrobium sp. Root495]KQY55816.1 hypothetical protein ASD11_15035 [Aeromicrobium sp. Root495]